MTAHGRARISLGVACDYQAEARRDWEIGDAHYADLMNRATLEANIGQGFAILALAEAIRDTASEEPTPEEGES